MKNTLKVFLAASLVAIAVAACNKPAENTETTGTDTVATTPDTTTTTGSDTVQAPADTTAAKQ